MAAVYANQHGLIVVEREDGCFGVEAAPEPEPVDTTDFDNACAMFRSVCGDIGALIGVTDFRGGFDDMVTFQQSAQFNTLEGLHLGMEWSAANELCKYEGSKIGLGQPEWWKKCWKSAK